MSTGPQHADDRLAPEDMDRDALESEVADLRREVRATNARMDAVTTRMDTVLDMVLGERELSEDSVSDAAPLFDRLDDVEGAVASHGDTLASIADVGDEATSEKEKISSIVAYAEQARDGAGKVLVTPKEIAGATGVSKRYAYDLVDKIGGLDGSGCGGGFGDGRFGWAAVRETTTVTTANGSEQKPKALKIDFDRVQRDAGALNWFNNGSGGEGGR